MIIFLNDTLTKYHRPKKYETDNMKYLHEMIIGIRITKVQYFHILVPVSDFQIHPTSEDCERVPLRTTFRWILLRLFLY